MEEGVRIIIHHVYPVNDILQHRNTEEGVCECCPRILKSPGRPIIALHNRFSMQVDEDGDVFVSPMLN